MCAKSIVELSRQLKRLEKDVDKTVKKTLLEFAKRIYREAMADLPDGAKHLKASFSVEVGDNGYRVTIFSGEEMAAYVEFGTGLWARAYLAGQPIEMKVEAIKFFINGKGKTPARPYLFPAFYRNRDWLIPELDRRIQRLFDAVI